MSRAIALAARARHSTSPNPMVGAVVVRGEQVVGEGHHRRAGGPHAEVLALDQARDAARGGTMYVTLEPCSHTGRTPPCVDRIVDAGIVRVVIAHRDPFPEVSGRGIRRLRAAGIGVEVGDGELEARALNARWLRAHDGGRPYVALKYAATLDGKIASRSGDSRWITGVRARAETHRLRAAYDVVMVGATTVQTDDPRLNARNARGVDMARQPLRVVVDGRLRTEPGAKVHDSDSGPSLVLAGRAAAASRVARFARAGVEVEVLPHTPSGGAEVLAALTRRGLRSVLVEGGGELAWTFVREGLVDRVYAFFGALAVGGRTAPTPVGGEGFGRLAEAMSLDIVNLRRLGTDVLVEAVAA